MTRQIAIYDTTLYASALWAGVPLTVSEKLQVLDRLDRLGVSVVEVGPPGPTEQAFFQELRDRPLKNARLCVFGPSTPGQPDSSDHLDAMLETGIALCTVAGDSRDSRALQSTSEPPDVQLKRIQREVAELKQHGREVVYDARYFFDGFKRDPAFALATLKAASDGGVDTIMLCDNSGMSLPWEAGKIVHNVRPLLGNVGLGIHMHNDRDCAVANSVAATAQGVDRVRGAINGFGERSGRANLCNIIPDLELKMGYDCLTSGSLPDLLDVSRYLAGLSGLNAAEMMPYVGKSDFAPV